jgi:gamma-glutamyltranspeptidase/glutathione hydrolase
VSAVVETISNVVDFGMNVQAAVDARRFHHQWKPDVLAVETGTPRDVIAALEKQGHAVKAMDPWGSVQAVSVDPASGLARGGSDSRSPGVAAGP